MNLPTGTLTFLFTDIEGSTALWERCPDAMRLALERHDAILKATIEAHNGYVFKRVGDAFCAAFPIAYEALNAALKAQLALLEQEWGETGRIRVRMALHSGDAQERDNDFFGPTLNRVARLQGIGHGQQTLLSQATYALLSACPAEGSLIDLGTHRLKDLAAPEHVWQLNHPSLPQEFPPLRSLNPLSTNLPQQLTSFIGREKEKEEIRELLAKTRLLTLTGSGGCGKTRLAVQVGAEVVEQYADGVWLVEMAPLTDPGLVPQSVADMLSIREAPGEPITKVLLSALKDKQIVLVLDNCEHVLDATARLVDSLLKSCPGIRVLASSREAMRISGESVYLVPSLSVPPPPPLPSPLIKGEQGEMSLESLLEYESVRLFAERAISARSDFAVTPQNASVLASVCYRLDGIPLAIELAAVRVRSLPLEEINSRLDNCFRLLTGGSRTALPRQQTLKALIDWSYDLLQEAEKILLGRLSVFAGGWSLEAAETVCGAEEEKSLQARALYSYEVLDLLTSLVDKSLAVYEEREGKTRYRLLDSVRQYAAEKLKEHGEEAGVRRQHRDYYLAYAVEADGNLAGPEQAYWLEIFETEIHNMRQALTFCLETPGEAEAGLKLVDAMQIFWTIRGYFYEGRERSAALLAHQDTQKPTVTRASALNGAGQLALLQSDYPAARSLYEEALTTYRTLGNRLGIARSLGNLGLLAIHHNDYLSARSLYEQSLAIKRELGDRRGIAHSLNGLGQIASHQRDYPAARALYTEGMMIWREFGDKTSVAGSLQNIGIVALEQGDYTSARALFEESLTTWRELGEKVNIALSLNNLGVVPLRQGDFDTARAYYQEALIINREIGNRAGEASSLMGLKNVAEGQGDTASARTYLEESLNIRREIGDRAGIVHSDDPSS